MIKGVSRFTERGFGVRTYHTFGGKQYRVDVSTRVVHKFQLELGDHSLKLKVRFVEHQFESVKKQKVNSYHIHTKM